MKTNWTFFPLRDLEKRLDEWQDLNRAGPATPLLDVAFVAPLVQHFAEGDELLAVASANGATQAMAILRRAGAGRWETFQPSQAPLGCWVQRQGAATELLLGDLVKALPGFALMVGMTQQDPDLVPRPSHSACLQTIDYIQTARVSIALPFEQYWEARGKNLKHNMKRQRARLEKERVTTRLEEIARPEGIAAAIEAYAALEGAGWKVQGGTAIAADNVQARFYRTMLENFAREGRARIYLYRFGDRVVAVDLCIEGSGSLIILKTTYDETVKTYSPAFLMRHESFCALFAERRVERIEFYGRLMEWHTRWTDEVRTMYHINHYRWPSLLSAHRVIKRQRSNERPASSESV